MGRGKIIQDTGREILSREAAFYHAVREYTGGVAAVAAVYGWNSTTLSKKISPSNRTHILTADEEVAILELTRDPRILDAICAPVDVVWQWAAAVPECPGDMDVLAAGNGLLQSASGVVDEMVTALEDGQIDTAERKALELKCYKLLQALHGVSETAGRFVVEPKA